MGTGVLRRYPEGRAILPGPPPSGCGGIRQGEADRAVLTVPFSKLTQSERSVPVAEGALLWARNKWLLAHPDSPEAAAGAFVGLTGENLRLW